MKAVLQYRASPGFLADLDVRAAAAGVDWAAVEETDETGFAREIRDADVLLHVLKPVTAQVMDQSPGLRLVQKLGVGVNTIDLDAARARGVAVANMPGANSQAVAEMTLALMFATLRRVPYFDALVRAGDGWRPDLDVIDRVGEIAGRTVGFLGFGGVPTRLAPVLAALGAEVIFTARSPKPGAVGRAVDLDQLLSESDILSLHAPLTDATRNLLDAAAFARMKPGAILINTARGELVDQAALTAALAEGRLAAAGLDVFDREPVDPAAPLFSLPNVVLAPHMAWLTRETLAHSLDVAFDNCVRLRDGRPLVHQVV